MSPNWSHDLSFRDAVGIYVCPGVDVIGEDGGGCGNRNHQSIHGMCGREGVFGKGVRLWAGANRTACLEVPTGESPHATESRYQAAILSKTKPLSSISVVLEGVKSLKSYCIQNSYCLGGEPGNCDEPTAR